MLFASVERNETKVEDFYLPHRVPNGLISSLSSDTTIAKYDSIDTVERFPL